MLQTTNNIVLRNIRKGLCSLLAGVFLLTSVVPPGTALAQTGIFLPAAGTLIHTTPAYQPAIMLGMTLHPENPLQFDFIIDGGDQGLAGEAFNSESKKLINYFLTALTVPEDQLWVNLSPYEKDRIIADDLSRTEMGRDMLAQDYLLKQLTASLMYPEDELGREFWQRIIREAQARFGTTDIPTNTFNKIWIIPEYAKVYRHDGSIFVADSHLNVMLEEDYLALEGHNAERAGDTQTMDASAKEIIREIMIPAIEKEINTGENFAKLRQIFNSMILAVWYKKNLRESVLGQAYVDQNLVKGVDHVDPTTKEEIYNQYIAAFKKGVFNYVKEDIDPVTQQSIPRKYFSGGVAGIDQAQIAEVDAPFAQMLLTRQRETFTVRTNLDTIAPPDQAMAAETRSDLESVLEQFLPAGRTLARMQIGRFQILQAPWRKSPDKPHTDFESVLTPFDESLFHFGKPSAGVDVDWEFDEGTVFWEGILDGMDLSFIEQKWPYALNHFLIVPQRTARRPQVLELADTELMLNFVRQQPLPGFRLGFNSLKSGASINHLHIHGFSIPPESSALEHTRRRQFAKHDGVGISRLEGYGTQGLLFSGVDTQKVAEQAQIYINRLQRTDVAHAVVAAPEGLYVLPVHGNIITNFGMTWSFYELMGFIVNPDEERDISWVREPHILAQMDQIALNNAEFLATYQDLWANFDRAKSDVAMLAVDVVDVLVNQNGSLSQVIAELKSQGIDPFFEIMRQIGVPEHIITRDVTVGAPLTRIDDRYLRGTMALDLKGRDMLALDQYRESGGTEFEFDRKIEYSDDIVLLQKTGNKPEPANPFRFFLHEAFHLMILSDPSLMERFIAEMGKDGLTDRMRVYLERNVRSRISRMYITNILNGTLTHADLLARYDTYSAAEVRIFFSEMFSDFMGDYTGYPIGERILDSTGLNAENIFGTRDAAMAAEEKIDHQARKREVNKLYDTLARNFEVTVGEPMWVTKKVAEMDGMFPREADGQRRPVKTDIYTTAIMDLPQELRDYLRNVVVEDWLNVFEGGEEEVAHYVVEPETYHISVVPVQDIAAHPDDAIGVLGRPDESLTEEQRQRILVDFQHSLQLRDGISLKPVGARMGDGGALIFVFEYDPVLYEVRADTVRSIQTHAENFTARPKPFVAITLTRALSNPTVSPMIRSKLQQFVGLYEEVTLEDIGLTEPISVSGIDYAHETRWMHTEIDFSETVPFGRNDEAVLADVFSDIAEKLQIDPHKVQRAVQQAIAAQRDNDRQLMLLNDMVEVLKSAGIEGHRAQFFVFRTFFHQPIRDLEFRMDDRNWEQLVQERLQVEPTRAVTIVEKLEEIVATAAQLNAYAVIQALVNAREDAHFTQVRAGGKEPVSRMTAVEMARFLKENGLLTNIANQWLLAYGPVDSDGAVLVEEQPLNGNTSINDLGFSRHTIKILRENGITTFGQLQEVVDSGAINRIMGMKSPTSRVRIEIGVRMVDLRILYHQQITNRDEAQLSMTERQIVDRIRRTVFDPYFERSKVFAYTEEALDATPDYNFGVSLRERFVRADGSLAPFNVYALNGMPAAGSEVRNNLTAILESFGQLASANKFYLIPEESLHFTLAPGLTPTKRSYSTEELQRVREHVSTIVQETKPFDVWVEGVTIDEISGRILAQVYVLPNAEYQDPHTKLKQALYPDATIGRTTITLASPYKALSEEERRDLVAWVQQFRRVEIGRLRIQSGHLMQASDSFFVDRISEETIAFQTESDEAVVVDERDYKRGRNQTYRQEIPSVSYPTRYDPFVQWLALNPYLPLADLPAGSSIVDVGASYGYGALAMAREMNAVNPGVTVYGVDRKDLVGTFQNNKDLRTEAAGLENLKFVQDDHQLKNTQSPQSGIKIITSFNVWLYYSSTDQAKAMGNLRDKLDEGGLLIIGNNGAAIGRLGLNFVILQKVEGQLVPREFVFGHQYKRNKPNYIPASLQDLLPQSFVREFLATQLVNERVKEILDERSDFIAANSPDRAREMASSWGRRVLKEQHEMLMELGIPVRQVNEDMLAISMESYIAKDIEGATEDAAVFGTIRTLDRNSPLNLDAFVLAVGETFAEHLRAAWSGQLRLYFPMDERRRSVQDFLVLDPRDNSHWIYMGAKTAKDSDTTEGYLLHIKEVSRNKIKFDKLMVQRITGFVASEILIDDGYGLQGSSEMLLHRAERYMENMRPVMMDDLASGQAEAGSVLGAMRNNAGDDMIYVAVPLTDPDMPPSMFEGMYVQMRDTERYHVPMHAAGDRGPHVLVRLPGWLKMTKGELDRLAGTMTTHTFIGRRLGRESVAQAFIKASISLGGDQIQLDIDETVDNLYTEDGEQQDKAWLRQDLREALQFTGHLPDEAVLVEAPFLIGIRQQQIERLATNMVEETITGRRMGYLKVLRGLEDARIYMNRGKRVDLKLDLAVNNLHDQSGEKIEKFWLRQDLRIALRTMGITVQDGAMMAMHEYRPLSEDDWVDISYEIEELREETPPPVVLDETGMPFVVKEKRSVHVRSAYSYPVKNDVRRELLAYYLARGRVNSVEIRQIRKEEAERIPRLNERTDEELRSDYYLSRLAQSYSLEELVHQDPRKARSAQLVFEVLTRKFDHHEGNQVYIEGVPVTFDHETAFHPNRLGADELPAFSVTYRIHMEGATLWGETLTEEQEDELRLKTQLEGYDIPQIFQSIEDFMVLDHRALVREAGYRDQDLEDVVHFLNTTSASLYEDVEYVLGAIVGQYGLSLSDLLRENGSDEAALVTQKNTPIQKDDFIRYFENADWWKSTMEQLERYRLTGMIFGYGLTGSFSRGEYQLTDSKDLDLALVPRSDSFTMGDTHTELLTFMQKINTDPSIPLHITLTGYGPIYKFDTQSNELIFEMVRLPRLAEMQLEKGQYRGDRVVYLDHDRVRPESLWALHSKLVDLGPLPATELEQLLRSDSAMTVSVMKTYRWDRERPGLAKYRMDAFGDHSDPAAELEVTMYTPPYFVPLFSQSMERFRGSITTSQLQQIKQRLDAALVLGAAQFIRQYEIEISNLHADNAALGDFKFTGRGIAMAGLMTAILMIPSDTAQYPRNPDPNLRPAASELPAAASRLKLKSFFAGPWSSITPIAVSKPGDYPAAMANLLKQAEAIDPKLAAVLRPALEENLDMTNVIDRDTLDRQWAQFNRDFFIPNNLYAEVQVADNQFNTKQLLGIFIHAIKRREPATIGGRRGETLYVERVDTFRGRNAITAQAPPFLDAIVIWDNDFTNVARVVQMIAYGQGEMANAPEIMNQWVRDYFRGMSLDQIKAKLIASTRTHELAHKIDEDHDITEGISDQFGLTAEEWQRLSRGERYQVKWEIYADLVAMSQSPDARLFAVKKMDMLADPRPGRYAYTFRFIMQNLLGKARQQWTPIQDVEGNKRDMERIMSDPYLSQKASQLLRQYFPKFDPKYLKDYSMLAYAMQSTDDVNFAIRFLREYKNAMGRGDDLARQIRVPREDGAIHLYIGDQLYLVENVMPDPAGIAQVYLNETKEGVDVVRGDTVYHITRDRRTFAVSESPRDDLDVVRDIVDDVRFLLRDTKRTEFLELIGGLLGEFYKPAPERDEEQMNTAYTQLIESIGQPELMQGGLTAMDDRLEFEKQRLRVRNEIRLAAVLEDVDVENAAQELFDPEKGHHRTLEYRIYAPTDEIEQVRSVQAWKLEETGEHVIRVEFTNGGIMTLELTAFSPAAFYRFLLLNAITQSAAQVPAEEDPVEWLAARKKMDTAEFIQNLFELSEAYVEQVSLGRRPNQVKKEFQRFFPAQNRKTILDNYFDKLDAQQNDMIGNYVEQNHDEEIDPGVMAMLHEQYLALDPADKVQVNMTFMRAFKDAGFEEQQNVMILMYIWLSKFLDQEYFPESLRSRVEEVQKTITSEPGILITVAQDTSSATDAAGKSIPEWQARNEGVSPMLRNRMQMMGIRFDVRGEVIPTYIMRPELLKDGNYTDVMAALIHHLYGTIQLVRQQPRPLATPDLPSVYEITSLGDTFAQLNATELTIATLTQMARHPFFVEQYPDVAHGLIKTIEYYGRALKALRVEMGLAASDEAMISTAREDLLKLLSTGDAAVLAGEGDIYGLREIVTERGPVHLLQEHRHMGADDKDEFSHRLNGGGMTKAYIMGLFVQYMESGIIQSLREDVETYREFIRASNGNPIVFAQEAAPSEITINTSLRQNYSHMKERFEQAGIDDETIIDTLYLLVQGVEAFLLGTGELGEDEVILLPLEDELVKAEENQALKRMFASQQAFYRRIEELGYDEERIQLLEAGMGVFVTAENPSIAEQALSQDILPYVQDEQLLGIIRARIYWAQKVLYDGIHRRNLYMARRVLSAVDPDREMIVNVGQLHVAGLTQLITEFSLEQIEEAIRQDRQNYNAFAGPDEAMTATARPTPAAREVVTVRGAVHMLMDHSHVHTGDVIRFNKRFQEGMLTKDFVVHLYETYTNNGLIDQLNAELKVYQDFVRNNPKKQIIFGMEGSGEVLDKKSIVKNYKSVSDAIRALGVEDQQIIDAIYMMFSGVELYLIATDEVVGEEVSVVFLENAAVMQESLELTSRYLQADRRYRERMAELQYSRSRINRLNFTMRQHVNSEDDTVKAELMRQLTGDAGDADLLRLIEERLQLAHKNKEINLGRRNIYMAASILRLLNSDREVLFTVGHQHLTGLNGLLTQHALEEIEQMIRDDQTDKAMTATVDSEADPKLISDLEPITHVASLVTHIDALDEKVELPLREAARVLFKKGIRTYFSSANRTDIENGRSALLMFLYEELSDSNKLIAHQVGQVDNNVAVIVRIPMSAESTVQSISRQAVEIANRFEDQEHADEAILVEVTKGLGQLMQRDEAFAGRGTEHLPTYLRAFQNKLLRGRSVTDRDLIETLLLSDDVYTVTSETPLYTGARFSVDNPVAWGNDTQIFMQPTRSIHLYPGDLRLKSSGGAFLIDDSTDSIFPYQVRELGSRARAIMFGADEQNLKQEMKQALSFAYLMETLWPGEGAQATNIPLGIKRIKTVTVRGQTYPIDVYFKKLAQQDDRASRLMEKFLKGQLNDERSSYPEDTGEAFVQLLRPAQMLDMYGSPLRVGLIRQMLLEDHSGMHEFDVEVRDRWKKRGIDLEGMAAEDIVQQAKQLVDDIFSEIMIDYRPVDLSAADLVVDGAAEFEIFFEAIKEYRQRTLVYNAWAAERFYHDVLRDLGRYLGALWTVGGRTDGGPIEERNVAIRRNRVILHDWDEGFVPNRESMSVSVGPVGIRNDYGIMMTSTLSTIQRLLGVHDRFADSALRYLTEGIHEGRDKVVTEILLNPRQRVLSDIDRLLLLGDWRRMSSRAKIGSVSNEGKDRNGLFAENFILGVNARVAEEEAETIDEAMLSRVVINDEGQEFDLSPILQRMANQFKAYTDLLRTGRLRFKLGRPPYMRYHHKKVSVATDGRDDSRWVVFDVEQDHSVPLDIVSDETRRALFTGLSVMVKVRAQTDQKIEWGDILIRGKHGFVPLDVVGQMKGVSTNLVTDLIHLQIRKLLRQDDKAREVVLEQLASPSMDLLATRNIDGQPVLFLEYPNDMEYPEPDYSTTEEFRFEEPDKEIIYAKFKRLGPDEAMTGRVDDGQGTQKMGRDIRKAGIAFIFGTGNNGSVIDADGNILTEGGALTELGHNILKKAASGEWIFTGRDTKGDQPHRDPGDSSFEESFSGPNIARRFSLEEAARDILEQHLITLPAGFESYNQLIRLLRDVPEEEDLRKLRAVGIDAVLKSLTTAAAAKDARVIDFIQRIGFESGTALAAWFKAYTAADWIENIILVSGVGEHFARIEGQPEDEDYFIGGIRAGMIAALTRARDVEGVPHLSDARIQRIARGIRRSSMGWEREILAARFAHTEIEQLMAAKISAEDALSIGISLGGTKIGSGLLSADGVIQAMDEVRWRQQYQESPDGIVEGIVAQIITLLNDENAQHLRKVGIAFAGPVDRERGIVGTPFKAPNLPFEKYDLRQAVQAKLVHALQRDFGVEDPQIIIDIYNDNVAAAIGEQSAYGRLTSDASDEAMIAAEIDALSVDQFQKRARTFAATQADTRRSLYEAWNQRDDKRMHMAGMLLLRRVEGQWYLLMGERNNKKHRGKGLFTIPSGKVEPGESILDGALREVLEETGIAITEQDVMLQLHDLYGSEKGILVQSYLAVQEQDNFDVPGGTPDASGEPELANFVWINVQELMSSPEVKADALKQILNRLQAGREVTVAPGIPESGIFTVFTNYINAIVRTVDNAMQASEEPGGIDFNPVNMDLTEQGDPIPMNLTPNTLAPLGPIQGIRPVIINITPVANLPLLLGLSDDNSIPVAHRQQPEETDSEELISRDPTDRRALFIAALDDSLS